MCLADKKGRNVLDYMTTRQSAREINQAIAFLEDALFTDMTLVSYGMGDEFGYSPINLLDGNRDWLSGDGIPCYEDGSFELTSLAHLMIHGYEQKLESAFPEMQRVIVNDLQAKLAQHSENGEITIECDDEHDMLFVLKSLDVDDMLDRPFGTTLKAPQEYDTRLRVLQ